MSKLVRFPLESGGSVLAEVDDSGAPGETRVSRNGRVDPSDQKFDEAVDAIRPIANTILEKLKALAVKPDELKVEFGLKLTAEAGAIIAKTQAEGSLSVSITWKSATASDPKTGDS